MEIIAQQPTERYLVLGEGGLARILDRPAGRLYPEAPIDTIISRGYWEDYAGTQEVLPKWLAEAKGDAVKYDPSQPRDEAGRWTDGGSSNDSPPAGLTPGETNAVTRWVTDYNAMHRMQANPNDYEAKDFAAAVAKSPPVNGTIYRGMQAAATTFQGNVDYFKGHVGAVLRFGKPLSTSPVLQVAAAYAEPVMLKITPQDGAARDITWKLTELGEPRFREAILAPGRFRVDAVTVETLRDSFYEKDRMRQAVVVSLTDVTQGDRQWTSMAPAVKKAAAAARHRMQGTTADFVIQREAIHNSGGSQRDARLNPIVARVKEQLVALAAQHANRPGLTVRKYDPSEPRDEAGRWTDGGDHGPAPKPSDPALLPMQKEALGIRDALEQALGRRIDWDGKISWRGNGETAERLDGGRMVAGRALPEGQDRFQTLLHEMGHFADVGSGTVEAPPDYRYGPRQFDTDPAPRLLAGQLGEATAEGVMRLYREQVYAAVNGEPSAEERAAWASRDVEHPYAGLVDALERVRQIQGAEPEAFWRGFLDTPVAERPNTLAGWARDDPKVREAVWGNGATESQWVNHELGIQKFDPDQPRDEFGKWTTGGFGAPAPTTGSANLPTNHSAFRDAVRAWTGVPSNVVLEEAKPAFDHSDIRQALLTNTPGPAFDTGMALLRAVAASGQGVELFRGLHIDEGSAAEKEFLALKPGDRLDINLSSWANQSTAGRGFAWPGPAAYAEGGRDYALPVLLHVADGHGLEISQYSDWPREHEWLSDGRFTVQSTEWINKSPGWIGPDRGFRINLTQDAVFQPDANKAVASLPLSVARFADWLEPYLEDEPVAAVKFDDTEPRDGHGRWTASGIGEATVASVLADATYGGKPGLLHHYTNQSPRISHRAVRLIPSSISTQQGSRGLASAFGAKHFTGHLVPEARILDLTTRRWRALWDAVPEDSLMTNLQMGAAVAQHARREGYDAVRVADGITGLGNEIAILNPAAVRFADEQGFPVPVLKFVAKAEWEESAHPRVPAGSPEGGEFEGGQEGGMLTMEQWNALDYTQRSAVPEEKQPWPARFQELNPANNVFSFMPGIALRAAQANAELTQTQKDALLGYQRDSTYLNNVLRYGSTAGKWADAGGFHLPDKPEQLAMYAERAKQIDEAIRTKGITSDKDEVVWRGVDGPSFAGRQSGFAKLVGSVIEDKGFLSTLPYKYGTEKFGPTDIRITVPAGTPHIELTGDSEGTEYLFATGSKLRIDEYYPRNYGSRPTFETTMLP